MLNKLLGSRTFIRPSRNRQPPPPLASGENQLPYPSPVVKIVHAGGRAELHFMAVPAAKIMEKYPSYVLTRPEVFRRPWESLVRPDEILLPGENFYVVPPRTVTKLRRLIRPRTGESAGAHDSDPSGESIAKTCPTSSSAATVTDAEMGGTSDKQSRARAEIGHVPRGEKSGQSASCASRATRRKANRKRVHWEPSLTVINES